MLQTLFYSFNNMRVYLYFDIFFRFSQDADQDFLVCFVIHCVQLVLLVKTVMECVVVRMKNVTVSLGVHNHRKNSKNNLARLKQLNISYAIF